MAPPSAPPKSNPFPKPGEVIEGKYQIERQLGKGAMGAVFQATHLLRQAPVALKFISPAVLERVPQAVDRFLNEGVAVSKIDCDQVVKVLDVSRMPDGTPYLVMDYVDGEDLQKLLRRHGKPGLASFPRAVHFVLQILRGLQVAHRAAIVHRDLKPANVIVTEKDGEPDFVKLLDFGISKLKQRAGEGEAHLTGAGASLGSPLYMSIEQARNPKDVDARTDLYSTAVILYELLVGRTPYHPEDGPGTFGEVLMKLASEEPPPIEGFRSDVPSGLAQAIMQGLAKDRDERYQTAAEMAEALSPYADSRSELLLRQMLGTPASSLPPPAGTAPHVPLHAMPTLVRTADGKVTQPASPTAAITVPTQGTLPMTEPGTQVIVGAAQAEPRAARASRPAWLIAIAVAAAVLGGLIVLAVRGRAGTEASTQDHTATTAPTATATAAASLSATEALGAAGSPAAPPESAAPDADATSAEPTATTPTAATTTAGRPRLTNIGIQP